MQTRQVWAAALGVVLGVVLGVGLMIPRPAYAAGGSIDSYVTAYLERNGIPGAAVAVVSREQVLHVAGYGTGVTARTAFPVASVSKSFTAVAVLRLVERGAVRLDEAAERERRGQAVDVAHNVPAELGRPLALGDLERRRVRRRAPAGPAHAGGDEDAVDHLTRAFLLGSGGRRAQQDDQAGQRHDHRQFQHPVHLWTSPVIWFSLHYTLDRSAAHP